MFRHVAALVLAMVSIGYQQSAPTDSAPKTPKLANFLGRTDLLLKVQHLRSELLVLPSEHKDLQSGSIRSHWVPAQITVLPVVVEDANKETSKVRGANFAVDSEYLTVGEYGLTEGKRSKGRAALDLDELVDMQTAIAYMRRTSQEWQANQPINETEVRFKSLDGLELQMGQDKSRKVGFILSVGEASVSFGDEQLAALAAKISNSITELNKR